MPSIYPVIMSGGIGSRLWPLSRRLFPKQLLSLVGERTLVQETALRTVGSGFAKPSIVCHADHRFLIAEQMRAIGIEPENVFLEPTGRNTAPAAAVAALAIAEKDPDAVLLLAPADQLIHDRQQFMQAIDVGRSLAKRGYLVTFGINPQRPDTGFGYIQRGSSLHPGKAFAVARFVEKPDAITAIQYIQAGDYYWNSGIFAFHAGTYISELERLEPDIVARCRDAISRGKRDSEYFRLDPETFGGCKSISIDYAVMERTDKAAIVPVDMGWSDVGSWAALWDNSGKDQQGNVVLGDVLHRDTRNSYLRSEGPLIAALGIEDMVVVASPDAVLVSPKAVAQDVKKIVEQLERQGRDVNVAHRKACHSWGSYECLDRGEDFLVTRFALNRGAAVSVQLGGKLARWVTVSGAGRLVSRTGTLQLNEKDAHITADSLHRLENVGDVPLIVIAIRHGIQSGEVWIVQHEDKGQP